MFAAARFICDARGESPGITRKTLSQLVNGHIGVSPTMAIRLALATNTTAETWLNMQGAYELWQAKQKNKGLKVERLEVG